MSVMRATGGSCATRSRRARRRSTPSTAPSPARRRAVAMVRSATSPRRWPSMRRRAGCWSPIRATTASSGSRWPAPMTTSRLTAPMRHPHRSGTSMATSPACSTSPSTRRVTSSSSTPTAISPAAQGRAVCCGSARPVPTRLRSTRRCRVRRPSASGRPTTRSSSPQTKTPSTRAAPRTSRSSPAQARRTDRSLFLPTPPPQGSPTRSQPGSRSTTDHSAASTWPPTSIARRATTANGAPRASRPSPRRPRPSSATRRRR